MDEQILPGGGQVSAGRGFARRLGAFAGAHYCYSTLCLLLSTFLLGISYALPAFSIPTLLLMESLGWLFVCLIPLALMGGYLLLGYRFGGKDVWPTPFQGRDLALSVLAEAAIAWCWAALVIGLFSALDLAEGHSLVEALFPTVFFLSFLGAFPSSVFVAMSLPFVVGFPGLAGLVFLGFWAGLLPPLLFNLGSYWQTCRAAGDSGPYEPNDPCL